MLTFDPGSLIAVVAEKVDNFEKMVVVDNWSVVDSLAAEHNFVVVAAAVDNFVVVDSYSKLVVGQLCLSVPYPADYLH